METKFQATENLSLENSFYTICADIVTFDVTIGIDESDGRGYFELCPVDDLYEHYYASGMLVFNGKELTDYDGVFALPYCIIDKLKELGYDSSYAE